MGIFNSYCKNTKRAGRMNENLYRLIIDFQSNVQSALKSMYRSGIQMPSSCYEWLEYHIPILGELEDGRKYYKHGYGCRVYLNSKGVDFDFGEQGEVGGFNSWWLTEFAGSNLSSYGFRNYEEVNEQLKSALDNGLIAPLNNNLYYFTGIPFIYASDTDARNPDDMLPCRDRDRVLTLQIHYFETADLMFKKYDKLNERMKKKGLLNRQDKFEWRTYLVTWLGFLGVVCEGFRGLNIRLLLNNERPNTFQELLPISNEIGTLMKAHSDSLRKFRNNVFHMRENSDFLSHFFDKDVERLSWARELHTALSIFFSKYRVLCEVHYIRNGRKGESELFALNQPRVKNKNIR
jgi:hypothetical protein